MAPLGSEHSETLLGLLTSKQQRAQRRLDGYSATTIVANNAWGDTAPFLAAANRQQLVDELASGKTTEVGVDCMWEFFPA